jgi:hypothetical protein
MKKGYVSVSKSTVHKNRPVFFLLLVTGSISLSFNIIFKYPENDNEKYLFCKTEFVAH